MDFSKLNTFTQVALEGSFSKAAKKLDYSQAAVTIQIKQLEKELGVLLFDRLGKQISLTNQGKVFLSHSLNILNEVEAAKEAMKFNENLSGHLNIGTISSFTVHIITPLIKKFRALYPEVSLNIVFNTPSILFEMLNNNELDFVYILDEEIFNNKLKKDIYENEEIVFVTSTKNNLLNRKKDIQLKNLIKHPFILTEKLASYRNILDNHLSSLGLELNPLLESATTHLLLQILLEDEKSVSFLPYFMVKEYVNNNSLQVIPVSDFKLYIQKQLFHHKDKYLTREMQAFIDLLKQTQ